MLYDSLKNYSDGESKIKKALLCDRRYVNVRAMRGDSGRMRPKDIIPKIDFKSFRTNLTDDVQYIWLGHSAFLVKIKNKIIMLDPMLGKYASPIPVPMLKRYSSEIPISIEEIDSIDIVLFSHDHYDHLDYKTIKRIKNKVKMFYVPLGLGSHLKHWGVDKNSITELKWDQSSEYDDIELVCLPSLHFS